MFSLIASEPSLWVDVADAVLAAALAIAALTPTDKDNTVVSRISNVWAVIRVALRK